MGWQSSWVPLTEIWRSNFWQGLFYGPGSRPVKPQLKPSSNSDLYHAIMRSPSFGLPSPNQITPLDLRARGSETMPTPETITHARTRARTHTLFQVSAPQCSPACTGAMRNNGMCDHGCLTAGCNWCVRRKALLAYDDTDNDISHPVLPVASTGASDKFGILQGRRGVQPSLHARG